MPYNNFNKNLSVCISMKNEVGSINWLYET